MQQPPPSTPPSPPSPPSPPRPVGTSTGAGRALLGLALVLPAGLALLVGYVLPTLYTFWLSFTDYTGLSGSEWIGLDNYQRLVEDERRLGFGFALSLALVPLGLLVLVAPLLAWAADRAGRPVRLATRLALTLPLVCVAPVAMAVAWASDRESRFWLADAVDRFGDPLAAQWTLRAMLWISLFGLVCALGVTVYLSAFRGRGPGRSAWPAVLTVAGLAVLAVAALALQSFTYPFTITGGGPRDVTTTPMLATYGTSMQRLEFGYASAQLVPALVVLMLLGVGAALLVILARLRVELANRPGTAASVSAWDGLRIAAMVVAVAGVIVVLALTAYGLWPWLSGLGRSGPDAGTSRIASILVNTWLPPLLSTVVGVGAAAVAGFGIGALRPFGRYSELLLLPFAPWLFIGVGPLFVSKFVVTQELGLFDSFLGRIPPIWLVVPALFLFTLLFRGLDSQRRAGAATGTDPGLPWVLLRSLPMLALVGAATWLVQSQSLLWGILSGRDPNSWTAPVWTVQRLYAFGSEEQGYAWVLPIPAIVVFAVLFGLLQVFYLDRLAIRVGRDQPS